MQNVAPQYGLYKRVDVETASQGKLIVLLFNGAIQRAEEAKRQIDKGKLDGAHNNLIRAQEIITELRSALDMKVGPIAHNLDRIYEYFLHLLVRANLRKDCRSIEECIELMTQMRDTWEEAFRAVQHDHSLASGPPRFDPHGAGSMNLEG